MDYSIIIYIIFGILPSLIWLFYYLSKDLHPEPKKMIVRIFLWGALITVPVFLIQEGFLSLLNSTDISLTAKNLLYWFLAIAFSEEFFKYLVFRAKAQNNPNLDEPLDVMLYMVITALGFAAVENILYLFGPTGQISFGQLIYNAVFFDIIRFIGATFLHTLCSAVVGYFLAISFYKTKHKYLYFSVGILLATGLHGLYDFSIINLQGQTRLFILSIIIFVLAILAFSGFAKAKGMKSICKIN